MRKFSWWVIHPKHFREFQLNDLDLKPIITWIEKKDSTTDPDKITPTQAELSLSSEAVKTRVVSQRAISASQWCIIL